MAQPSPLFGSNDPGFDFELKPIEPFEPYPDAPKKFIEGEFSFSYKFVKDPHEEATITIDCSEIKGMTWDEFVDYCHKKIKESKNGA